MRQHAILREPQRGSACSPLTALHCFKARSAASYQRCNQPEAHARKVSPKTQKIQKRKKNSQRTM
jgi:hypothetical protein